MQVEMFQWLFSRGKKPTEKTVIKQTPSTNFDDFPEQKLEDKRFIINIPPKYYGHCVCGCRGQKWTSSRRIKININLYKQCPARIARKENEKRKALFRKQKKMDSWKDRHEKNLPALSKAEAKLRELNTFEGKTCEKCKTTTKLVRGVCEKCKKIDGKLRDAMKRGAFPENLTPSEQKEIIRIYEKSRRILDQTGIEHHVDHIKPLSKGGRHHPSNLQILTAEENLKKGAKWRD